jgi:hypothetical protein
VQLRGQPSSGLRMHGMNDCRTPASWRCMLTTQEGWDAEKRVHEPKGVTGPR